MGSRVIKKRRGTKRKRPVIGLVYVLAVLTIVVFAGSIGVYALGQSWLQDLPDYESEESYNLSQKTRVYASDNTTLLAEFYTEDREPVTKAQISPYVWNGTVATEDERFYQHSGIDVMGILRAVAVNLTGGELEGASTITQQLVRNTVLADEATDSTLKRKVREAYIAIKFEEMFSKEELLLMYLNTINYGNGVYGIQAAAQKYYSKPASDLTVAEAAALIGIPQSPTNNNPIASYDNCLNRRNVVLSRMLSNNVITQEQYDEAVAEPLNLEIRTNSTADGIYLYPYFTSYVRETLLDMYSSEMVYKGGLTVYTTLDPALQEKAEAAATSQEAMMASDLEVAMSVVDPDNGYIKAIVGGRDYYTDEYNLATQARRQPGSSFKTFTLVSSIENGVNPNTTYLDCGATATLDNWKVSNIDNVNYGTRSVASAFEVSSNTGFARLCTWLGPLKVAEMANRLGIGTELSAVPSITLGSQGVTLVEMSDAYATIANGGTRHEAACIVNVLDSDGEEIYRVPSTGTRAISSEVASASIKVMKGVVTNGTGTAASLGSVQESAGKTGTSENYRDSWYCGITPQYSVAIWIGAREERNIGSVTAAPVFRSFMLDALSGVPSEQFIDAGDPPYTAVNDSALGISSGSSYDNYNYGYYSNTGTGTAGYTGTGTGGYTGTDTGGYTGTGTGGETYAGTTDTGTYTYTDTEAVTTQ